MKVRGRDVLLPTTLVGAYPRPVFMEGKVFGGGCAGSRIPQLPDAALPALGRAGCQGHDRRRARHRDGRGPALRERDRLRVCRAVPLHGPPARGVRAVRRADPGGHLRPADIQTDGDRAGRVAPSRREADPRGGTRGDRQAFQDQHIAGSRLPGGAVDRPALRRPEGALPGRRRGVQRRAARPRRSRAGDGPDHRAAHVLRAGAVDHRGDQHGVRGRRDVPDRAHLLRPRGRAAGGSSTSRPTGSSRGLSSWTASRSTSRWRATTSPRSRTCVAGLRTRTSASA